MISFKMRNCMNIYNLCMVFTKSKRYLIWNHLCFVFFLYFCKNNMKNKIIH